MGWLCSFRTTCDWLHQGDGCPGFPEAGHGAGALPSLHPDSTCSVQTFPMSPERFPPQSSQSPPLLVFIFCSWVQILALSLTGYVILDMLLEHSGPQFLTCEAGFTDCLHHEVTERVTSNNLCERLVHCEWLISTSALLILSLSSCWLITRTCQALC